jgi:hypothetical protein
MTTDVRDRGVLMMMMLLWLVMMMVLWLVMMMVMFVMKYDTYTGLI